MYNITKQMQKNECGICVINSIFQHYYGYWIKNELINHYLYDGLGISVDNFEKIANEYGITTKSYFISFDELINDKYKDQLVTLIQTDQGLLHYVIIKIKKHFVKIYDSQSGIKKISYQEFSSVFKNIIICCKKKDYISHHKKQKIDWHEIKTQCHYVIVSLTIMCIEIISAFFISVIIENAMIADSWKNLITIITFFILANSYNFFANQLLLNLLQHEYEKKYLSKTKKFTYAIFNKTHLFLLKNNYLHIKHIEKIISNICHFEIYQKNRLYSAILFIITITFFFAFKNQFIAAIILCYFILMLILNYINEIKNESIDFDYDEKNISINNEIINILKNQRNKILDDKIQNFFTQKSHAIINFEKKQINKQAKYDLINQFVQKLFLIVIITVVCLNYYDNHKDTFDFFYIVLSCNLIFIDYDKIITFFKNNETYKNNCDLYNNIIETENIKSQKNFYPSEFINKITINNNGQEHLLTNGQKITQIEPKKFIDKITRFHDIKDWQLFINNTNIMDYDYKWVRDTVIVFDPYINLCNQNDLFNKVYAEPIFLDFIKKFQFPLLDDSYQKLNIEYLQIINVMSCLLLQNKIIIFNNCFKYIHYRVLEYIKVNVIPYIQSRNFIILTTKLAIDASNC